MIYILLIFAMSANAQLLSVTPRPQQVMVLSDSSFALPLPLRMVVADAGDLSMIFLQAELNERLGEMSLPPVELLPAERDSLDRFSLYIGTSGGFPMIDRSLRNSALPGAGEFPHAEEYQMLISHERIVIAAEETRGLHWGIQTLLQLIAQGGTDRRLSPLYIRDWPDYPVRVVNINGSMRNIDQVGGANFIADLAYRFKFNEIEWNNNDAGRSGLSRFDREASLALRKKIASREQRLSMGADRTAIRSEHPGWQEAVPARNVRMIATDSTMELLPALHPPVQNGGFEHSANGQADSWYWPRPSTKLQTTIEQEFAHGGNQSLCFRAIGGERASASVQQFVPIQPYAWLRLVLWYRTERCDGGLYLRAQGLQPHYPTGTIMRALPIEDDTDWTKIEVDFSSYFLDSLRLVIGAAEMTSGRLWIDDVSLEPAPLSRVIRRPDTPVRVFAEPEHAPLTEGLDYRVVEGAARGAANYLAQPRFERIASGALHPGDTVSVDCGLGILFQQQRETICFSLMEPLLDYAARLRAIDALYAPEGWNVHINEISYAGYDSLCRSGGKSPAQLVGEYCRGMIDSIRALDADAPVRIYGDPFDVFVQDVRAMPVDYRPWTRGVNGRTSLSFLPRDVQIMAMAHYTDNLDSSFTYFAENGFDAVLAMTVENGVKGTEAFALTARKHDNCIGLQCYGWFPHCFTDLNIYSNYAWNLGPFIESLPVTGDADSLTFRAVIWTESFSGDAAPVLLPVKLVYAWSEGDPCETVMHSRSGNLFSLTIPRLRHQTLTYRIEATDDRGETRGFPAGADERYAPALPPD